MVVVVVVVVVVPHTHFTTLLDRYLPLLQILHDAFPGERELMGICSRALSWAQREYRLVSTGSQAGGLGGDEGSRWKRPWAEFACVSESSFSPGFLV